MYNACKGHCIRYKMPVRICNSFQDVQDVPVRARQQHDSHKIFAKVYYNDHSK